MTRQPLLIASRSLVTLCAATVGFLAGWLAYRNGFDGIGDFLTTAWEVSRGYSSALSFALDRWWIGVASFLIWLFLLIIWPLVQRPPPPLLSLSLLAVP